MNIQYSCTMYNVLHQDVWGILLGMGVHYSVFLCILLISTTRGVSERTCSHTYPRRGGTSALLHVYQFHNAPLRLVLVVGATRGQLHTRRALPTPPAQLTRYHTTTLLGPPFTQSRSRLPRLPSCRASRRRCISPPALSSAASSRLSRPAPLPCPRLGTCANSAQLPSLPFSAFTLRSGAFVRVRPLR